MKIDAKGRTLPGFTHHIAELKGANLHYVSGGASGSPILLVHGFPETWWAFHKMMPALASTHRVFAVDLPGFGDSGNGEGTYDSETVAAHLHQFLQDLDLGPVHLVGQDVAGAIVFRLASTHPDQVRSLTAIEMGLPGFGLEGFADVTHGGAWYIGFLAAGIPEVLLSGREREFVTSIAYPAMCAVADAVGSSDIEEYVRTYARPNGWRGAVGLYRSMLEEGSQVRELAKAGPLRIPVLAIGAGGAGFTATTMRNAGVTNLHSVLLDGVGHFAAMEAPDRVAEAILEFID